MRAAAHLEVGLVVRVLFVHDRRYGAVSNAHACSNEIPRLAPYEFSSFLGRGHKGVAPDHAPLVVGGQFLAFSLSASHCRTPAIWEIDTRGVHESINTTLSLVR